MVRLRVLIAAAVALSSPSLGTAEPVALPPATFEDQDGRMLTLVDLRGQVAVIVYGRRAGIEHHIRWGKRLDGDLRARGVYGAETPPDKRPVHILAMAQMGGIPQVFRAAVRGVLKGHVEAGYSLWLDWDDRMSASFGSHERISTVVVVDRDGTVRLVVSGLPEGDAYRAVTDLLDRLR